MKVILQTDVKGMGKRGDVVNASDGHARNYLFPKKLAIPADKQNMNVLNAKKAADAHRKELEKAEAIKIKERLEKETLTIKTKAGENGRIFGSVTSKEIADGILDSFGFSVDKKKIIIKEQIKALGGAVVELKLFEGVSAKLRLLIIGE